MVFRLERCVFILSLFSLAVVLGYLVVVTSPDSLVPSTRQWQWASPLSSAGPEPRLQPPGDNNRALREPLSIIAKDSDRALTAATVSETITGSITGDRAGRNFAPSALGGESAAAPAVSLSQVTVDGGLESRIRPQTPATVHTATTDGEESVPSNTLAQARDSPGLPGNQPKAPPAEPRALPQSPDSPKAPPAKSNALVQLPQSPDSPGASLPQTLPQSPDSPGASLPQTLPQSPDSAPAEPNALSQSLHLPRAPPNALPQSPDPPRASLPKTLPQLPDSPKAPPAEPKALHQSSDPPRASSTEPKPLHQSSHSPQAQPADPNALPRSPDPPKASPSEPKPPQQSPGGGSPELSSTRLLSKRYPNLPEPRLARKPVRQNSHQRSSQYQSTLNFSWASELSYQCREPNCQERLSVIDGAAVRICEKRTQSRIQAELTLPTCRFVTNARAPVALNSQEGSGNTWLRGLLEKASGICTGFYACDFDMRAAGFVGENIKSGSVLVVKTHVHIPQWIGQRKTIGYEGLYGSAVFLIRNPARSTISEWNRLYTLNHRQRHHYTQHTHVNVIPKSEFATQEWRNFTIRYLNRWQERVINWVFNNNNKTHPVLVISYENLKRDTVKEVEKILDFLHFPYNHEEVVEKLKEDYTTFQRPHMNDNFQHYSAEQKDLLRKTIIELKMAAETVGKERLFLFDEYLESLSDII